MVTIERASAEDASRFAALEQEADTKNFVIPYSVDQHQLHLADATKVYLRILERTLVGFFLLGLDGDGHSVEFRRIVVGPKGRGIGQQAILLMEQFSAVTLRRSRVWLDVFEDNHRGRHIYEKLGYAKFGESSHGERRLLLYEKQLAAPLLGE